jgi:hypothetical protein
MANISKRRIARGAAGLALAFALVAVFTAPTRADDWHDRDWHDHEIHARDWHVGHPHPVASVVYAPPIIVAPPPPPPPTGISLIIPLNIR